MGALGVNSFKTVWLRDLTDDGNGVVVAVVVDLDFGVVVTVVEAVVVVAGVVVEVLVVVAGVVCR